MSLFELYKFSFLKQGVSHSCHVDKLSVPIFSAPRKDTSGISDPKITLELLFSDSTLDNLRFASHSKERSGKGEMALRCDLDSDALETII